MHLPKLVLADANARVGSEPTPCLGPLFPETSNHAGTEFLAFCEATALVPLNTWVGSAGPTWFGPHGEAHRIDYVLASQQLVLQLQEVGSSHAPLASVEIKQDHWAVYATFAAMQGAAPDEYRWNPALISRELTRDPDCKERFRQILQSYRIPDFSTNIDLRQHDTMCFILDAAQQCFPIRAARPRSPWITESSWQWMRFRYTWRKRARLLWARARTLQLLLCFRAWQAACDLALDANSAFAVVDQLHRATIQKAALFTWVHDATDRLVAKAQRTDYKAYLEEQTRQMQLAANAGKPAVLFGLLRRLKRKPCKVQLRVLFKDGAPAQCPSDARCRWLEHFADLRGGEILSLKDSFRRHLEQQPVSFVPGPVHLPLPSQIAGYAASMRSGKAAGIGGLPPDAFKADPEGIAKLYYPLLLKANAAAYAPWKWQGSIDHELPKKPGFLESCSDSRAISICSPEASLAWRVCRATLMQTFGDKVRDSQFGGFPGRTANYASHTARTFVQFARHSKTPAALLFLDYRTAFYKVLRETMFARANPQTSLQTLLARLRISPEAWHSAQQWIHLNGSILLAAEVPPDVSRFAASLHCNTWFVVQGSSQASSCTRGVSPGNAAADLLFSMVVAQILAAYPAILKDLGLYVAFDVPQLPWGLPIQGYSTDEQDLTYVDDTALMLVGESPMHLLHVAAPLTVRLEHLAETFGLEVNHGKGKTEIMFLSAPSAAVEQRLFLWGDFPSQNSSWSRTLPSSYQGI